MALSQITLNLIRKYIIKKLGHDQPQNPITQKFQPLVIPASTG